MEEAKSTFENQWAEAFEDAEVSPPAPIWIAIDGHLANQEMIGYRRRATLYQRMAVACLLLLTLGGAYVWNQNNELDTTNELTKNPIVNTIPADQNDEIQDHKNEKPINKSLSEHTLVLESKTKKKEPSDESILPVMSEPESPQSMVKSMQRTEIVLAMTELDGMKFKNIESAALSNWQPEHLYGVPITWEIEDKRIQEVTLWAGVSFGAGAFDPGFSSQSDNGLMAMDQVEGFMTNDAIDQSAPNYSTGHSKTGGFDIGTRVKKRFLVSSGVHYSAFNTSASSTALVTDEQSNYYALTAEGGDMELVAAVNSGNLTYSTQEVELSNEYEYVTIPLKAGFIVLDKKFNITLLTGVSSNFLVNARLAAGGSSQLLNNDFETTDTYKTVYFNFLSSIQFGYSFAEKYQISIEPNYNQALNDFTNSKNANQGKPKNLGVSLGFKYNF